MTCELRELVCCRSRPRPRGLRPRVRLSPRRAPLRGPPLRHRSRLRQRGPWRKLGLVSALDVQRVALRAEHEVALRVGHVVERHRCQRLDERHPVLGVRARARRRGSRRRRRPRPASSSRPRPSSSRAVDDPHHLLRASGAVPRATVVPGSYATWQRSTCSPPIARSATPGKMVWGSTPFQVPKGRAQAGTSKRMPPLETAFTESSSSKMTSLPSRRGSAFASSARSTFSGVIGSSVTQTPTAS